MLFKVREETLNQLINEKLADQEVRRLNLSVSEAEVDQALERIKEANHYTDAEFREALGRQGMSPITYRQELKEQILRSKLVNLSVKSKIVVTEADVKAYFDENQESYRGERKYHLRNIIMVPPAMATAEERASVGRKMEAVRQEFLAGADFGQLARQYSESPLAEGGGDLGLFSPETMAADIRAAMEGLEAGEVTPVLDTDQGYQLFYVEEIVTVSGKTLEEAAPEIEDKLYKEIVNQKYQEWLEELRNQAHIKVIR
jgi:peptidyl-prolyl cis-trans isomerase SurA